MKRDMQYSIILTLGMVFVTILSMINPVQYFQHIAAAISAPLFFFTMLEVMGHVRTSIGQELSFEKEKMEKDIQWVEGLYNYVQDSTEDYAQNIKKRHRLLVIEIVKIDKKISIIKTWFKFYDIASIFLGIILFVSIVLANLGRMVKIWSRFDSTVMTLFTAVIFIGEPWFVDILSKVVRNKADKKVEAWVEKSRNDKDDREAPLCQISKPF